MSSLHALILRLRTLIAGKPAEPPVVPEPPAEVPYDGPTVRRQIGTKADGTPVYVELRPGRLNGVIRQPGAGRETGED
jgi:hypothetical protein